MIIDRVTAGKSWSFRGSLVGTDRWKQHWSKAVPDRTVLLKVQKSLIIAAGIYPKGGNTGRQSKGVIYARLIKRVIIDIFNGFTLVGT